MDHILQYRGPDQWATTIKDEERLMPRSRPDSFGKPPALSHAPLLAWIDQELAAHGRSDHRLALQAGLSTATVPRLRSGQPPGLELCQKLARVFEYRVSGVMEPKFGSRLCVAAPTIGRKRYALTPHQGCVLIVDELADEKAGDHSAGAGLQYNGRIKRVKMSQVGVDAAYANVGQRMWT